MSVKTILSGAAIVAILVLGFLWYQEKQNEAEMRGRLQSEIEQRQRTEKRLQRLQRTLESVSDSADSAQQDRDEIRRRSEKQIAAAREDAQEAGREADKLEQKLRELIPDSADATLDDLSLAYAKKIDAQREIIASKDSIIRSQERYISLLEVENAVKDSIIARKDSVISIQDTQIAVLEDEASTSFGEIFTVELPEKAAVAGAAVGVWELVVEPMLTKNGDS